MSSWKKKKRAQRRRVDKQRGLLEKIARGKLSSGLTPDGVVLLAWARFRIPTTRTWYIQDVNCGKSQCLICGSQSTAPARLRWMWILKHEQDHVIALGRENVAAFKALAALSGSEHQNSSGGWVRPLRAYEDAFETVFGTDREGRRW